MGDDMGLRGFIQLLENGREGFFRAIRVFGDDGFLELFDGGFIGLLFNEVVFLFL